MVQVVSDIQFDLWSFVFRKAFGYDSHRFTSGSQSLDPADLPGLTESFSFDSRAALWDGTGGYAASTNSYAYLGTDLAVNSFGMPVSGTVTGLLVGDGTGKAAILGGSIDAADIFAASRTSDSRADDFAILRRMFVGDDQVRLSGFGDWIATGLGRDVVQAGGGNDTVMGNQGRDFLYGQAGDDQLSGGYGYDRLAGGTGRDLIFGGYGNDRLLGNQQGDILHGNAGDDSISGGYGYDRLFGGIGSDTLSGGYGSDTLDGGSDAVRDTFVFADVAESALIDNPDVIHNFDSLTDLIDLSAIDANTNVAGNQSFAFGGSTAGANAVWHAGTGASLIVMADVNGDAHADFWVRVTQISSLAAGDFAL